MGWEGAKSPLCKSKKVRSVENDVIAHFSKTIDLEN